MYLAMVWSMFIRRLTSINFSSFAKIIHTIYVSGRRQMITFTDRNCKIYKPISYSKQHIAIGKNTIFQHVNMILDAHVYGANIS